MSGEGYLRKARDQRPPSTPSRPQSFSERLASARQEDALQADRKERIQQIRTKTFDIGQREIEKYKQEAVDILDEAAQAPQFSREDVLGAQAERSTDGGLPQNTTATSLVGTDAASKGDSAAFETYSGFHLTRRNLPHTVLHRHMKGKAAYSIPNLLKEVKGPDFQLPDIESDIVVFGIVAEKSAPQSHKRNAYSDEPPKKFMVIKLVDLKWEIDLFLFNTGFERFWKLTEGTVVAILNPELMPPKKGMEHTNKFSLVISSDMDTIIELGRSRDLGYCQSVKKDGNLCGSWVNMKRTHYCEWHTQEAVNKTKSGRVEMNNGLMPWQKQKKDQRGGHYEKRWKELYAKSGVKGQGSGGQRGESRMQYDAETGSKYFMARNMSAADLIDGKDITPNDRRERAAALKRRMIAQEEERAIAARLRNNGDGAGKEYMRVRAERPQEGDKPRGRPTPTIEPEPSDRPAGRAAGGFIMPPTSRLPESNSLPIIGPRDRERKIELGPVKRKRADSSSGVSSRSSTLTPSALSRGAAPVRGTPATPSRGAASSASLGWGGNLRDKLARMRQGEKLRREELLRPAARAQPQQPQQPQRPCAPERRGSQSPAKKKTRFVTEKGIREAGRESLGGELSGRRVAFDDDEDELEIV